MSVAYLQIFYYLSVFCDSSMAELLSPISHSIGPLLKKKNITGRAWPFSGRYVGKFISSLPSTHVHVGLRHCHPHHHYHCHGRGASIDHLKPRHHPQHLTHAHFDIIPGSTCF